MAKPMKSVALLKNIFSFAETLQLSTTEAVNSWDKESLQNALQWASYCEQLYRKSNGKPYASDLDRQIRQLGKSLLALGNETLSLESLRNCRHRLTMNLIQNPHLDDQLFGELVPTNNQEIDSFLESCFELSENKAALQLALTFKDEITHSKDSSQSVPKNVALETQASLLCDHMTKVLSNCHSTESAEEYLLEKLNTIVREPDGMVLLLHCLLVGKDVHSEELRVFSFLLQFVTRVFTDYITGSMKSLDLQDISSELLTAVASSYHSFFEVYLKYLSYCIDPSVDITKINESTTDNKAHETVIQRVTKLLNCELFISAPVNTWLMENEKTGAQVPNIWTHIRQASTELSKAPT